MDISYRILDYEQVEAELSRLENNLNSKIPVMRQDDFKSTRFGYPVEHFTIGNGDKHIVVVGNTHGSEIISCDFVMRLMESVSEKKNGFENFDENEVTIDFIPLHNPEGYIISSSAIRTLITDDMNDKEKEAICKKYWTLYYQDDIDSKENNDDHTTLKRHQKMFEEADYTCINEKHKLLRESVKEINEKYHHPVGSMIMWRANGSGVELNRNQPFNSDIVIKEKQEYGSMRYNNILKGVKGPLGASCYDSNRFTYEAENENLFELLDNLYRGGKYCGMLTYHSTWGKVFANPSYQVDESLLDDERRYHITAVNQFLAKEYEKYSGYEMMDSPAFDDTDDVFRILYPGTLLIELSKLDGNPIGPYCDITGNYNEVMVSNMKATANLVHLLPKMHDFLYERSVLLNPNENIRRK